MTATPPDKSILLIGASRGLGYAMAAEYLKHGWNIVATVRGKVRTKLHELAQKSESRIEIRGRRSVTSRRRSSCASC